MIGRRQRPASTPLSAITIVGTAGLALVAFVALIWLAVVAPRGVPGIEYRYVNAQFRNAANVPISTEVRVAGKNAGQVTKASLRGDVATLRLQLRADAPRLRTDARARIGLKGLLGGKYVEIDPGRRGRELADEDTLPTSRTETTVDVLDVAQALDARRRADLRAALRGGGQGFAGRGEDVNNMLRRAKPVTGDLQRISSAVLAREGAAGRLFPSLESASSAFDPVRNELAGGLRPEASVLETFARRRGDVRHTLDVAPSTLVRLRDGLNRATPLLYETEGLANEAVRFTRPAPAALDRTAALLKDARPALRASTPLLRTARGAVPPAVRLLRRVDPVTAPTRRVLARSLPPLTELGGRECDVTSFVRNWRSMMGYGVAPGGADPLTDLDDDAGLGALNSVRLIVGVPPPPDSGLADTTPVKPTGNAYPAACKAEGERRP